MVIFRKFSENIFAKHPLCTVDWNTGCKGPLFKSLFLGFVSKDLVSIEIIILKLKLDWGALEIERNFYHSQRTINTLIRLLESLGMSGESCDRKLCPKQSLNCS